jgi:hypothetical protein
LLYWYNSTNTDAAGQRSWDAKVPHKGNPFKFEPLHVGLGAHLHAAASAADTPSSLVKGVGKGFVDVTI